LLFNKKEAGEGSWGGNILPWEFLFGKVLIEAEKQYNFFYYKNGDPCRARYTGINYIKGGR
jgi:hypothetical protein